VAIEENRLVFRRITRMTNGKAIASEENKTLRIYSAQEQFQGTAPVEQTARTEQPQTAPQTQQPTVAPVKDDKKPASPTAIVSPLEQWEKQSKEPKTEPVKDAKTKNPKADKPGSEKKSVKVSETKKVTETKTKSAKKPAVRIAQSSN
jgi:ABC-type multidrug transport system ATPase subunit